jgi:hypothetical protein
VWVSNAMIMFCLTRNFLLKWSKVQYVLVEVVSEIESGKRLELSDKSLFVLDRKQIPIIHRRIQISYRRSYSGIKIGKNQENPCPCRFSSFIGQIYKKKIFIQNPTFFGLFVSF